MGADGGAVAPGGRDVAPGLNPGGAEVAGTATAAGAAGHAFGAEAATTGSGVAAAVVAACPELVAEAGSLVAGALEDISLPKLSINACVLAFVPCMFA